MCMLCKMIDYDLFSTMPDAEYTKEKLRQIREMIKSANELDKHEPVFNCYVASKKKFLDKIEDLEAQLEYRGADCD